MNLRLLLFTAVPLLVGMSASASRSATITCSTVAACMFGNNTAAGNGVEGTSGSGHGVQGFSATGFGVVGITTENATSSANAKAGVEGTDASTNGTTFNSGVHGWSAHGIGVSGTALDGAGVLGTATTLDGGIGVHGVSPPNTSNYHSGGPGVQGDSYFGSGVVGNSAGGLSSRIPYITDISVGVFGSGPHGVKGVATGAPGGYPDKTAGVIGIAGNGDTGLAGFTSNTADIFEGLTVIGAITEYDIVAKIDYKGNEILAGTLTTHGSPMVSTKSATGDVGLLWCAHV